MVLQLPERLVALRPDASALLSSARAAAIAQLGAETAARLDQQVSAMLSDARRAALTPALERFVEQFVVQVSDVTRPMVAAAAAEVFGRPVAEASPSEIDTMARSFYVIEYSRRLHIIATRLFGGSAVEVLPHDGDDRPSDRPSLRATMSRYQEAVVRGDDLDATLTELVRLRCARTHHCEICSTLRLASARDAGVDATVTDMVDRYEQSPLPERCKTVLRLTDAFILHPTALTDSLVAEARSTFSDAQLAEWCLDVTKWSTQKVNVALGTDGVGDLPINEQGVAYFDFDDDGRVAGYSPV